MEGRRGLKDRSYAEVVIRAKQRESVFVQYAKTTTTDLLRTDRFAYECLV